MGEVVEPAVSCRAAAAKPVCRRPGHSWSWAAGHWLRRSRPTLDEPGITRTVVRSHNYANWILALPLEPIIQRSARPICRLPKVLLVRRPDEAALPTITGHGSLSTLLGDLR